MRKLCKMCSYQYKNKYCAVCQKDLVANFELQLENLPSSHLHSLIYFGLFHDVAMQYIYKGKYEFHKEFFHNIGLYMASQIRSLPRNSLVSYVPSTWMRYCMRGFNPSKVLAQELAAYTESSFAKGFKRVRPHKSLVEMNRADRMHYCSVSFDIFNRRALLECKNLFLVDDVYTTGGTLEALARLALEINPGLKITGICFVKTPLKNIHSLSQINPTAVLL